ncbi:MAG: site-2 protease family protein, partial [Oscillospiraceae bacterium]|nr:site-2 protease family protein [Oscillospiraceae bacterium]
MVHAIVLFTAFPVHECAHAWTAEKLGDDTARKAGRITLNPFKHLSLMGTLMMLFVGFGWAEPVPVDARKFKNPKNGMAFTAIAGPLSNLIMAFVAMAVFRVLYAIAYYKNLSIDTVLDIFWLVTYLNIGLAVFNLLPIPPLDGSRIFNLVMPEEIYFYLIHVWLLFDK